MKLMKKERVRNNKLHFLAGLNEGPYMKREASIWVQLCGPGVVIGLNFIKKAQMLERRALREGVRLLPEGGGGVAPPSEDNEY